MPVSQKMLAANRINAKKSTGPRTKRGKDRARMNALRHGFFAQGLLLTDEDRGEFWCFREKTLKTLAPQDVVELILCERIVSATWRLRRLQTIENVTHHTCAGRRIVSHDFTMRQLDEEENGTTEESPEEESARRKQMEEEMMAIPGISEVAMGLAQGDDLMDRLSRCEMRLEMSSTGRCGSSKKSVGNEAVWRKMMNRPKTCRGVRLRTNREARRSKKMMQLSGTKPFQKQMAKNESRAALRSAAGVRGVAGKAG